jgi:hypothetical protein
MPKPLDIDTLSQMKNFVADRPEFALLAFSMCFNIVLFFLLMRSKDQHLKAIERWLPIVERLSNIVERFKPRSKPRAPESTENQTDES